MKISGYLKDKRVIIGVLIIVFIILANRYFKYTFFVQKYVYMDTKFKYFVYSEFDSPATDEDVKQRQPIYVKDNRYYLIGTGLSMMSDDFIYMLDTARDLSGVPFTINSGYRTRHYNDNLDNAVSNSAHIYGVASDISTAGMSDVQKDKVLDALRQAGFIRIGKGRNFYHVDIDETKPQKEWTYA